MELLSGFELEPSSLPRMRSTNCAIAANGDPDRARTDDPQRDRLVLYPTELPGHARSRSCGGYRLTKDPADYTTGEILRAIEGSVAPIPCLGSVPNECPMSEQCFTLPFWAGLVEVINQYIDSVTLEQLAQSLPAAKDRCCGCNTKT